MSEKMLTGKPSIDKPWLQYFPPGIEQTPIPEMRFYDFVCQHCPGDDVVMMNYYGTEITWKEFKADVERAAKALKSLGIGVGSKIPMFLKATPAFYVTLFATELVGATLLCRDGDQRECFQVIDRAKSEIMFEHDYLSKEDEEVYLTTELKKAILVSPYEYATEMADYNESYLKGLYPENKAENPNNLTWKEFLALGDSFEGEYLAPVDTTRLLYCPFTTGSTGDPKQVNHCAKTMVSAMFQLSMFGGVGEGFRPLWLHTLLPPSLIAIVIGMTVLPIVMNMNVVLDPWLDVHDVDLAFMKYRPNCWPTIPMFVEILISSKRIPEDYDMSFFMTSTAGAEALNNSQIKRTNEFLEKHNSKLRMTTGYGMTEAGSAVTLPCPVVETKDGCTGMPMPMTIISIFKPGTQEECSYGERGEICISSPAVMLGYEDGGTEKVLQKHPDGRMWLHSGDIGYMTEVGALYVLNRGPAERFGGGDVFAIPMENKVVHIEGIADAFFVIPTDADHEGYFVPYLYVVLKEGYTVADVEGEIRASLEEHEQPVEIVQVPERLFFHFKTARKVLAAEIAAKRNK